MYRNDPDFPIKVPSWKTIDDNPRFTTRTTAQHKEKMGNMRKKKRSNKSGKAPVKFAFDGQIKRKAVGTRAAKVTIEADDDDQ